MKLAEIVTAHKKMVVAEHRQDGDSSDQQQEATPQSGWAKSAPGRGSSFLKAIRNVPFLQFAMEGF